MTRRGFLAEVKNLLSYLSENERTDILQDYNELFDQYGPEGEEELLRVLGTPTRQVLTIDRETHRNSAWTVFDLPNLPPLPVEYEEEATEEYTEEAAEEDGDELPPEADKLPDAVVKNAEDGDEPEDTTEPESGDEPEDDAEPEDVEALPGETDSEALSESPDAESEAEFPAESDDEATIPAESADEGSDEALFEDDADASGDEAEVTEEEAEADGDEAEAAGGEAEATVDETEASGDEEISEAPASQSETPVSEAVTPADDDTPYAGNISAKLFREDTPILQAPEKEPVGSVPAEEEKPGAGRVIAAVLVSAPMAVYIVVGFALFIALGAVFMALGVFFGCAGVYLAGYAFGGLILFMPDMLLTVGAMLIAFCLAVLLLWTGIWIAVGGGIVIVRSTGSVYKGILHKKEKGGKKQ